MKFLAIDRDGVEILAMSKPEITIKYKVHKKDYGRRNSPIL